ncbi:MAG: hypothetical protein ACE5GD_09210 [Candidatus Geothermarchaeales archaeon]
MNWYLQIDGFGDESFLYLFVALIAIFVVMQLFDSMKKRRQFSIERPLTRTELTCPSCDLREVREYRDKDHVLKKTDEKCKKCEGNLIISSIYAIPAKK